MGLKCGKDLFNSLECLVNLIEVTAATHCAVGTSTALAAGDSGDLLEDVACVSACLNSIGTCGSNKVELTVSNSREYSNAVGVLGLNGVTKAAYCVGTHIDLSYEELEFTYVLEAGEEALGLDLSKTCVRALELLGYALDIVLEGLSLLYDGVGVLSLEFLSAVENEALLLVEEVKHTDTGGTLNSSYTCRNGGLGDNLEQTDLTGVGYVSTAAKLGRGRADLNYSYGRAVLLTEESHCAHLTCGVNVGYGSGAALCGEDSSVDKSLNLCDLFLSECRKMCEVETNSVLINVRACLLNVSAEHGTKSRLKKVSGGVVSLYGITSFLVYSKCYGVAELDLAVFNAALVEVYAVGLLGVEHGKCGVTESDNAGVAYLTAALAVEYGLVGNNGALALGERLYSLAVLEDAEHLTLALVFGVAEELGLGEILEK